MSDKAETPETPDFSFGGDLKKEREIRGISLAEIAEATKISKRFLDAIERNDFAALPAPVFTRGFVREYARYVGLNADEMVDRYAHFIHSGQAGEDQPQPLISTSSVYDRNRRSRSSVPPWVWGALVLLIILAIAGYMLWRSGALRWPGGRNSHGAGSAPSRAAALQPATAPAMPIEKPPPAAEEMLTLSVEAMAPVWIVADADGQRALHETLKVGDRRTVNARSSIALREVGSAGDLRLTLNGIALPSLGPSGEVVRERTFDHQFLSAQQSGGSPLSTP